MMRNERKTRGKIIANENDGIFCENNNWKRTRGKEGKGPHNKLMGYV